MHVISPVSRDPTHTHLAHQVAQTVVRRDNTGLQLVSFFISVAHTGEKSKWSINSTISGGSGTETGVVVNGSRLRASAFEWATEFLNCKLYS